MLGRNRAGHPDPRSVPHGHPQNSYCVITRREDGSDRDRYRVWRRTTADPEPQLIGHYTDLEDARNALPIDWRDASSGNLVAWALFTR